MAKTAVVIPFVDGRPLWWAEKLKPPLPSLYFLNKQPFGTLRRFTDLRRPGLRGLLVSLWIYGAPGISTGPKVIARSEQQCCSRLTEVAGPGTGYSLHMGGSRTYVEHKNDMAQELGRVPQTYDFFVCMKSKNGKFVDKRSQKVAKEVQACASGGHAGSDPGSTGSDAGYITAHHC